MEHIKNIEIKNFKSIRHAKIEDCRRINVFVGYPNVGKSNILEALGVFCVFQEIKLKDVVRLKEDTTIFYNGFINNEIEILVDSIYKLTGKYIGNEFHLGYSYAETPQEDFKEVMGFRYRNFDQKFFFGKEHSSLFPYSIKKYEFDKNKSKKVEGYERLNMPFGDNIFSILSAHETLREDVSELFKKYNLELLFDSRAQAFTILKRTRSGIFSIPYELIADTLQRIIFYKAAIQSNERFAILFEEPEAHMFPPYISKFTTDIILDKRDNQFFISTHSPFVLSDFMEHAEREDLSIYTVGYKNDVGETTVNRLTDDQITEIYQYGVDLFFNLEDYLKDSVT